MTPKDKMILNQAILRYQAIATYNQINQYNIPEVLVQGESLCNNCLSISLN